ncbi:hypothetical protein J6590_002025 [Homalodisca vitripennis]|nr:hypothetical protein J6590_002025 [Homalodisca vitripennis]
MILRHRVHKRKPNDISVELSFVSTPHVQDRAAEPPRAKRVRGPPRPEGHRFDCVTDNIDPSESLRKLSIGLYEQESNTNLWLAQIDRMVLGVAEEHYHGIVSRASEAHGRAARHTFASFARGHLIHIKEQTMVQALHAETVQTSLRSCYSDHLIHIQEPTLVQTLHAETVKKPRSGAAVFD